MSSGARNDAAHPRGSRYVDDIVCRRRVVLVAFVVATVFVVGAPSIARAQDDAGPTHRFEVGAHLGASNDHWGAPDQSTTTGVVGLDARYAVFTYLAIGVTGELTFLPGTSGANLQYGLAAAWLRFPSGKIRPYAHAGMGVVHGTLETSIALGAGAGADWCFGPNRDERDCGPSLGPFVTATIGTKDADLTLITFGARAGTSF
jgi:hypothetical protein